MARNSTPHAQNARTPKPCLLCRAAHVWDQMRTAYHQSTFTQYCLLVDKLEESIGSPQYFDGRPCQHGTMTDDALMRQVALHRFNADHVRIYTGASHVL